VARERRRLAAILAADMVGYSRLTGRDESGTLSRLRKNRTEHLNPVLTKYGGRLVKLTGDGALVEFASAVDALSAAIEFQQAMAEVNSDRPTDTALVFRMGLHLGDLIVEGDDLYGDGVNIAARLEAEAPAGGIVMSRTVHEAVTGRVKATFEDLGSLTLKNIERPIQAFSVKWEPSDWQLLATPQVTVAPAAAPQVPLPLSDKPSIAVLPFQNMSGDPEQEYFGRYRRGHHHCPISLQVAVCNRAKFIVHLQGPPRRHQADRARAWRALRVGGQRAQIGGSGAHHRPAH
jgi:adenylate cyclase